jgi:hypothetical protein
MVETGEIKCNWKFIKCILRGYFLVTVINGKCRAERGIIMVKNNKKNFSRVIILSAISLCFILCAYVACDSFGSKDVKASGESKIVTAKSLGSHNETMFQAYEWNTNRDGYHWDRIAGMSDKLSELGISSVWLPPAYKGMLGIDDTGYNPYDLYDLGEFQANNTDNGTRTRYGTKDQYINMINRLHDNGLKVYADVVLNHKAGGEGIETVQATMIDPKDRNRTLGTKTIGAYSVFNFDVKGSKSRNNKYSSFKWNASCFDAVDS